MQKCFRFGAHTSGRIFCSLCHDVLINVLLLIYYWIFSSKEPVLYVFYVYIMTINVFWIENWIVGDFTCQHGFESYIIQANCQFYPDSKVHGANMGPIWGRHLGPTGPRWTLCWPHELCYLGRDIHSLYQGISSIGNIHALKYVYMKIFMQTSPRCAYMTR